MNVKPSRDATGSSPQAESVNFSTEGVLVSLVSSALPADIWFPATEYLKPEKGLLCSIGLFKNFSENTYETSVSVFYKHMNNLVEFKNSLLDIYMHNFYERITTGKGFACGNDLREGLSREGQQPDCCGTQGRSGD